MTNILEQSSQKLSPVNKALDFIKKMLTSPYGVAAIASLSFHGVLFAAVPRFSSVSFAAFNDDGSDEPRTVPLVTLSAAEQGRLPNFNPPQLSSIPDITSATSPRSLPTLRTPPVFNRSSGNSRLSTPSRVGSSSRYNSNNRTISRSRLNSTNIYQNPYIPRPRNIPNRSTQSNERYNTPVEVPTSLNSSADTELTADETLKKQQQIEDQQAADQAAIAAANDGESDGLEPLDPLPEDWEPGDGENSGEEGEDVAVNTAPEEQLSTRERLQAKFQYDETNTTPEEVEQNYTAWVSNADETSEVSIETVELSELPVPSGFSLCVANPPTDGEVGILVSPNGTPGEPVVLRSTGYDHINQLALDMVRNGEYPQAEAPIRYPFSVKVDYDADNCSQGEQILETAQTEEAPVEE
ncbi:MAG: hypothetical protein AAFY17_02335 [Cyanobacteria bacterium J06642_11]